MLSVWTLLLLLPLLGTVHCRLACVPPGGYLFDRNCMLLMPDLANATSRQLVRLNQPGLFTPFAPIGRQLADIRRQTIDAKAKRRQTAVVRMLRSLLTLVRLTPVWNRKDQADELTAGMQERLDLGEHLFRSDFLLEYGMVFMVLRAPCLIESFTQLEP